MRAAPSRLRMMNAGRRRLVVFCPAFVADCLETLEEIGLRAHEDFTRHGGERLTLVPSLNAQPAWADAVVALVRRQAARYGGAEPPTKEGLERSD